MEDISLLDGNISGTCKRMIIRKRIIRSKRNKKISELILSCILGNLI